MMNFCDIAFALLIKFWNKKKCFCCVLKDFFKKKLSKLMVIRK